MELTKIKKVIRINGVKWETLPEEQMEHTVPFGGVDADTGDSFDWSTLNGEGETDVLIMTRKGD